MAWKITQFIQKMQRQEVDAPGKLKSYNAKYIKDGKLTGLDEDDKKYLRVYYEVLERYPREKLNYGELPLKALRDRMRAGRKSE